MADVLSVIASGVAVAQLAGTAGGAVLKLKRLWDQVKDVPETIRDLMEQIDCLDPALWQAEQQFAQNELPQLLWNDEAAVRSVTYCRKALGKLTELVNDLDVQINTSRRVSKKVARIKVALKKDELNKLERRLDNAVRMLQAAQQGYIITLLKLQPDIIVGKFMSCIEAAKSASNSGTIVEIDPQDDRKEVKTYSIQRKVTRKPLKSPSAVAGFRIGSSSEGLSAGFRPPWWLFGVTCAFEFNARRSLAGWDIRLRTYAVVPYNTPIWAAMSGGHVERARAIFDSRQASPFDVDELGRSLLFRAIYWCSPAILELILNLHVFSEEEVAQNIVSSIHTFSYLNSFAELKNTTLKNNCNMLISKGFLANFAGYVESTKHCNCCLLDDWDMFQLVQPIFCPNHQATTLTSRMKRFKYRICHNSAVSRFVIGWDSVLDSDGNLSCSESTQASLLHTVARNVCWVEVLPMHPSFEDYESKKKEYQPFAVQVVKGTKDLHRLESSINFYKLHTPLTYVILGLLLQPPFPAVLKWTRSEVEAILVRRLRQWLMILQDAGVNIAAYGRREDELLRGISPGFPRRISRTARARCMPGQKSSSHSFISRKNAWSYHSRLLGFKTGPNIEDWGVWMTEPTDRFAGHFWTMIEASQTPHHVPGAWVDSENDNDSLYWSSDDDIDEVDSSLYSLDADE